MIIPNLPFYWRVTPEPMPAIAEIPTRADFSFECTEDRTLMQFPAHEAALAAVYQQPYNVGYLRPDFKSDREYFTPFWHWMVDIYRAHGNVGAANPGRAIDIGAGFGFLARWLQNWTGQAWGLEPSPCESHPGARMVKSFAETGAPGNFDIITHHHVLEHVPDPVVFLYDLAGRLSENGLMFLAVPDCAQEILLGDISLALHQHRTYYSIFTLREAIHAAGLEEVTSQISPIGGTIFLCCRRAGIAARFTPPPRHRFRFDRWEALAHKNCAAFSRLFDSALIHAAAERRSIGFYCPLRAWPYLGAIGQIDNPALRFFDDAFAGQYIDGFARKIEGIEDLERAPPYILFIMAGAASDVIEAKVTLTGAAKPHTFASPVTRIITLRHMLEFTYIAQVGAP